MSTFRGSSRRSRAWLKAGRRRAGQGTRSQRRIAWCEPLEARQLLAADWQNPFISTDANDDGSTTAIDALVVANGINVMGQGELKTLLASAARGEGERSVAYYDVNGDDYLTSNDFLRIANAVNEGEGNDTMTYTLRTFNEAGTAEISTIGAGQRFQLRAFVRDNRTLGNFPNGSPREGVFSAYLDVKYPAALADVAGPFVHNTVDYGQAPSGNTSVDGVIDGAGSFRGSLTPTGRNEFLLWSLPMTAQAVGSIAFTGEPTTDPSDPGDQGQSPSLDTGVYDQDQPVCPSAQPCVGTMAFMNTTLAVVTDIAAGNDAFTVAEDSGSTAATPPVTQNDQVLNPPGGTPTITAVTQGSNGATVAFTASNVSYQPAPNFNGTDIFTYTISNGLGATADGTVTVTVTPSNDAPVATVPGAQTTAEDTARVFNTANGNRISFADVDGNVNVQATLTVGQGTLSVPSTAGVTIVGNNTANLQLTGAINAVNSALDGSSLTYQPNPNFNGSDTLQVSVNDQGNTGGSPLSDSKSVSITITSVNDAPQNTTPGNQQTDEEVPLVMSTAGGNALSVADVDAGNSPLQVRLSVDRGGRINLGSTTGLTVTGNGTASVDITGTVTAISTALGAGVTFTPDAGFADTATFTIRSDDQGATGGGGPQVDSDSFPIDVLPTVRPRAVSDPATIAEDNTTGVVINVLQNDRANDGRVVTLVSFTQPANGGTVALIDNGTPGNGRDDSLRFTPTANFAGTAIFSYTIDEIPNDHPEYNGPSTGSVTVTVTPVNDPPVNTVPGAQTTAEDVAKSITGISVADIDAGTGNIEVTLSVTNGVLNVTPGAATAANNGTNSVRVTGTLSAVNAALAAGVNYTPTSNFNGGDTLTVATSDLGSTGTPGPLTDTDTVAITVTPVNDAPVNSVDPDVQVAFKDEDFVFSTAEGNAFQTSDADAGNAGVQVTLSTASGTLAVNASAGVTIAGSGTGLVTLTGPIANLNTAMGAGVTFHPAPNFSSPPNAVITMVTNDLGNTGGPAQSDTDTVEVNVQVSVPSTVGGGVFVDANGNGARDTGELGISGVLISLQGLDVFGQAVNLTTRTSSDGRFSFGELKPGTYTLEESQPAGLRDGADLLGTGFTADGDDRATISIVAPGGVSSTNTLFSELGLEAQYLRAGDLLLASSGRPDQHAGVILGVNGSDWAIFRGSEWAGYDRPVATILSHTPDHRYAVVRLSVRHVATGTTRTVTLDSAVDPRLIYINDGGESVIRFKGRPEDLFLAAAEGEGEGEGMSAQEYSQSVDEVMAFV